MGSFRRFSLAICIAILFTSIQASRGARHLLDTPPAPTLTTPYQHCRIRHNCHCPSIPTLPKASLPPPLPSGIPTLPQPTLPTAQPFMPKTTLPPLPTMPTIPTVSKLTLPPQPSLPTSLPIVPSIPFLSPPPSN